MTDFSSGQEMNKTKIMVYTPNLLARGEVATLPAIRVSTWMRTQAAPEYLRLMQANVLVSGLGGMQNLSYDEFILPAEQVIAYHIVPPTADPLDYDQSEPNRKLEPVTILVGSFKFKGSLRMATQSNLWKFMETARQNWTSVYDVEITNPGLPSMGVLKVPLVLVRIQKCQLSPLV